ncbi:hypothetical protein PV326_001255, partial [Microctonus aethiopoides]
FTGYFDEISSADCNEKLICSDGSNSVSTVLPLDGTPCGDNKVCWGGICQDLLPHMCIILDDVCKCVKLSDPSISHDQINFGPSTSSQDKPSKKRPTTSSENEPLQKRPSIQCTTSHVPTLYPEILVFVAYDVIQFTKTVDPNNYLALIVRRYIIYFNTVDMLFAKLSAHGINIHINIAGIVID